MTVSTAGVSSTGSIHSSSGQIKS